ncbi:hypothetical protein [Actinorugispora endophytica]|uniref:Uncharacterized protein n=1 Tax=Actinorugispora endophytica TaxID=1605990 RepID=A0A4R6UR47_9ACTN|nr:hypothetical protein [Actinorugispora endophytica]TDQ48219.1 hypothetical protein EV190_11933 [Actinorugispora endophytica]
MLRTYQPVDLQRVIIRLRMEFKSLPQRSVERCVTDTWRCAEHLGFEVTPRLVERVAREHLRALVKSEPPSAARPRPGDHDRLS